MYYVIVFVVALVVTFMGFMAEVLHGNIRHLENGRDPEAGASIFPNIVCVPLLALGLASGLNQVWSGLGFKALSVLLVVILAFWTWSMWSDVPRFRQLMKEREARQDISVPHKSQQPPKDS